jgi:hypothetical protein
MLGRSSVLLPRSITEAGNFDPNNTGPIPVLPVIAEKSL